MSISTLLYPVGAVGPACSSLCSVSVWLQWTKYTQYILVNLLFSTNYKNSHHKTDLVGNSQQIGTRHLSVYIKLIKLLSILLW